MADILRDQISFAVRRHWDDVEDGADATTDMVMQVITDIVAENKRLTRLVENQSARLDQLTRDRDLLRKRVANG